MNGLPNIMKQPPNKPLILELGGITGGVFTMPYEAAAKLEAHPLALLFPPLNEDDMDTLAHNIIRKGQIHAVVLYENKILDGVHRTKACLKNSLDVKCIRFEDLEYTGTAADFVLSENNERRHMDDKTRTLVEASVLDFKRLQSEQAEAGKQGGRNHKKNLPSNSTEGLPHRKAPDTREKLATRTGVSHHTAQKALDIVKHAPELAPQVAQGRISFEKAAKEAKQRAPARKPRPKKAWNENQALAAAMRGVERHFQKAPQTHRKEFVRKFIERLQAWQA